MHIPLDKWLVPASVLLATMLLLMVNTIPATSQIAPDLTRVPHESSEQMAVADTYLAQGRADSERGGVSGLWVGYDRNDGFLTQRTLLKFDIAALPANSVINSAEIVLTLGASTSNDSAFNVVAYRTPSDWEERVVTWNSGPAPVGTSSPPVLVGTDKRAYRWNVASLVQEWMNEKSGQTEISFLLQADVSSDRQRERGFWSKECPPAECNDAMKPRLIITYRVPPPPPPPPVGAAVSMEITPPPTTTVAAQAATPMTLTGGEVFTYTIRVDNGVYTLTNVILTVPFSATIRAGQAVTVAGGVASTRPAGSDLVAGVLRWTIGELKGGESWGPVSFQVQVPVSLTADYTRSYILHSGTALTWQHEGKPGSQSKPVSYPSLDLSLPLIVRAKD